MYGCVNTHVNTHGKTIESQTSKRKEGGNKKSYRKQPSVSV